MSVASPALAVTGMFSMKREIKIIMGVLAGVAMLPWLLVIILTQMGINSLGSVLATNDPTTSIVDIHDPATGAVIDHVTEPRMWPVKGPVTLEFGESDLPYQPFHTGIDIASPNHQVGDPVAAFMVGTVTYAGSISWGFGTHVEVDDGHHVTSIYGHLDSLAVIVGQKVEMGTIVGTRGTTGWSTGPHLHFQINVFGIPVNPRTFVSGDP